MPAVVGQRVGHASRIMLGHSNAPTLRLSAGALDRAGRREGGSAGGGGGGGGGGKGRPMVAYKSLSLSLSLSLKPA